jgi:hypothetical protein
MAQLLEDFRSRFAALVSLGLGATWAQHVVASAPL